VGLESKSVPVGPNSLTLEEAVAIAQHFLGPETDLFLTGGFRFDEPYYEILFYTIGEKSFTTLYVTNDGTVFRNQHAIPNEDK
jgi:hypothetical protein